MGGTGLEVARSLWEADLETAGFRVISLESLLSVRPTKWAQSVREADLQTQST